jgi:hypothetical protein
VVEAARHHLAQEPLPGVAERRVAEVVAHHHRLDQHLVEPQRPGDGAGHLGDLEGVGEPGPVVIAARGEEHLGLAREAAERLRVEEPVPVALEDRPLVIGRLGPLPAPGAGGARGARVERALLELLEHLADRSGHRSISSARLRGCHP